MGNKPKTIRDGKVRLDIFRNKNVKGSEYLIFKLLFYQYKKPSPICLRRHEVLALQRILSGIRFQGHDSNGFPIKEEPPEEVEEEQEEVKEETREEKLIRLSKEFELYKIAKESREEDDPDPEDLKKIQEELKSLG